MNNLIKSIILVLVIATGLHAEKMIFMNSMDMNGNIHKLTERQKLSKKEQYTYNNVEVTDIKVTINRGMLKSEYFYNKTLKNDNGNNAHIYIAKNPYFAPFYMRYLVIVDMKTDDGEIVRAVNLTYPLYSRDGISNVTFALGK